MTCIKCLDRFHVHNCSAEEDDQCTSTFLKGWSVILAKYPNIAYTCDEGLEKTKLDNGDILVNRLAVMEDNIREKKLREWTLPLNRVHFYLRTGFDLGAGLSGFYRRQTII